MGGEQAYELSAVQDHVADLATEQFSLGGVYDESEGMGKAVAKAREAMLMSALMPAMGQFGSHIHAIKCLIV